MVSPKTFNKEILFDGSADLDAQMLGITKSKFDIFNVFTSVMEGYDKIHVYAILGDGEVYFPELNIRHTIGYGDYLAYRSDLSMEITTDFIQRTFSYSNVKEIVGVGSKMYEVVATIRDEYRVFVYADSEEDAIKTADGITISEWRHPDIPEDSHLEDRRIIRHARWGNLSANEIKD